MSTYADDVYVIVSNRKHIDLLGEILQEYEELTGTKLNLKKSVDFRLDTYKASLCRPTAL